MDIPYLCDDIVFEEILTRVPADFLHNNFRLVCRKWTELISNPRFIKAHYSNAEQGLITLGPICFKLGWIAMRFMEIRECKMIVRLIKFRSFRSCEMPNLKSYSNGLLLLQDGLNPHNLYVVNPATSNWISFPPFSTALTGGRFDLVYVPCTQEYKVVHLIPDYNSFTFQCEIFTCGGSDSWRLVDSITDNRINKFFSGERAIVRGIIHWNVNSTQYIISMDLMEEKFRVVKLPHRHLYTQVQLIEKGGFLSFLDRDPYGHINVWVLKDFQTGDWVKEYIINMPWEVRQHLYHVITTVKNGEVIVFRRSGKHYFCVYDLKVGQWRVVKYRKKRHRFNAFYGPHANSLFSLNN
ncbi:PREDICTED: F-box protein At3g07870-like [Nelumbo nucifera]|uniref:F-box protein At3g07870-like n=2 Tax=Nelumbo nucifera TaxID=4432 RepID=A0A1U8ALB1_NELNU|nr:PREDICTED: F-box protein At3g07870-like [Nelumbo nucifera]DAD45513.1 TPA_asm: hypothetical protein HUJ06_003743 [Nelumbo nucifera]